MNLLYLFVMLAILVAGQGLEGAPVMQGLHPDASDKYKSIIEDLLAAPDESKLCSIREELSLKDKTPDVDGLLEFLDQRALELHGIVCSSDLELSEEADTSAESEYHSEAPTSEPASPHEQIVHISKALKTLLDKALLKESGSGPEFDSVMMSSDTEVPCVNNCHTATDIKPVASTFKDDDELAAWRFKLAMKILMAIICVFAFFWFLITLCIVFC